MAMNLPTLALEDVIFLGIKGLLNSHVIRHSPTWTGMLVEDVEFQIQYCVSVLNVSSVVLHSALALNCNVHLNDKNGAESKNWKGGKPVRVVRNCKGRKHSKYSPEEGNRYDGIYKVQITKTLDCVWSDRRRQMLHFSYDVIIFLKIQILSGGEVLACER